MSSNSTSKFISLILRHKPETIGISLDEHGWANVDELIEGIAKTRTFDMPLLEKIVSTDEKQRYSFSDDKTLIRANQGHSIPVDVELPVANPPEYLYHGTGEKYVSSIDAQGLIPKMSDGTLWEGQTALYFRWIYLPDCAVPELAAGSRRDDRKLS